MKRHCREHIIILFSIGVLALNYPLLSLFDHLVLPLNIPLLYLYVFLVWLLLIVALAFIVELSVSRSEERPRSDFNGHPSDNETKR